MNLGIASGGRLLQIGAMLFFVAAVSASLLSRFEHMMFNNDWLNSLGWGVAIDVADPTYVAFIDAAKQNCIDAAPSDALKRECVAYQNNLAAHFYLGHPTLGLAGAMLASNAAASPDLLVAMQRYLFLGVLATLIFSLALAFAALQSLSPQNKALYLTIFGALFVASIGKYEFGLPKLGQGFDAPDAVVLLAFAAAAYSIVRAADAWRRSAFGAAVPGRNPADGKFDGNLQLLLLVSLAVAAAQLGAGRYAIGTLAVLVLALLALRREEWGLSARQVACAWCLVVVFSLEAPNLFIYMRSQVAVVFAAFVALSIHNKQTKLLYLLMPLGLVLHVASATVVALSIFGVEILALILRRERGNLLWPSLVTLLLGAAILYFLGPKSILGVGTPTLFEDFFAYFASSAALPGLLALAATLLLGLHLLRSSNEVDPALGRALLYFGQLLITSQFIAFANTYDDQSLRWFPGLYSLRFVHFYYGPAAALIGIVYIVSAILRARQIGGATASKQAWEPQYVAALCVASFLAFNGPTNFVRHVWYGLKAVAVNGIQGQLVEKFVPYKGYLTVADDRYFLSRTDPRAHPLMYASLVKLKIKLADKSAETLDMRLVP